ncbi:hypothetical protein PTSG_08789 [Salpingoeca rosetta]|uniref:Adenylate cyclase-associated CAP C-terminal domain-containing protein n=1 Tax=Salpingoeca rosetta (strain ATCC 50818 / BSB-021) TaxID=946362 RepID=F2UKP8_SALR5|nr:uncharacterized protein PTSG_08789 [Salpingoeca rosetta]EGD77697.1 hypothetical protein PTSG_08789 [Salpingoeca rosetta]|eukprot:XP_004990173.1 hypothetical protein PTSG_08789 [Salpingoeca rosetta]
MSDQQQPEEGPRPAQRQRMEEQLQFAKHLLAGARGKEAHTYEGLKSEHITVEEGAFSPRCALIIADCEDCTIDVEARCAKVSIQSCSNLKLNLKGKIITHMVEANKSKGLDAIIHVPVGTLQVDVCEDCDVVFQKKADFGTAVWVGCHNFRLSFADSEDHKLHTGVNRVREEYPEVDVDKCQFKGGGGGARKRYGKVVTLGEDTKVTVVEDELLNEPLMRLPNSFPTTQREHNAFEARRERNMQRLADHLEQLMPQRQQQQQNGDSDAGDDAGDERSQQQQQQDSGDGDAAPPPQE